ncbi:MAG: hypothetical protein CMG71_01935 [Candidatus Marinimicrobia bacterium]|nr:hypothetical protein [Candidatus Neomarinimicrobiota bacterium]|tara:strand:+ start:16847 stop:18259 length:1413 start_codon:yes stop_codon:yes gene_type:complete
MKDKLFILGLFLLCIVSRIASAVYYIEDIDSLRFALSLQEYDITKLQPNFPGYFVFYVIAKIIYIFTNSFGATFGIVGGISIFIIIWVMLKLCHIDIWSEKSFFCILVIGINPMLWVMSNRYMPDLTGIAIWLVVIYLFSRYKNNEMKMGLGYALIGLLLGTKLTYFPLIICPLISIYFKKSNRINYMSAFIVGCSIWIIPIIWITGFNEFIYYGMKHVYGHFFEYGGTVFTDRDMGQRVLLLLKSLWADGLGGYWEGRNIITLLTSAALIPMIYGLRKISSSENWIDLKLIIYSVIPYILWLLLFQNVIYKTRHVLPIIITILMLIIIYYSRNDEGNLLKNISTSIYIIALCVISTNIVVQHKQGTAINKAKNHLERIIDDEGIISQPLVNLYLRSHHINAEYTSLKSGPENNIINHLVKDYDYYLVGNYTNLDSKINICEDKIFYHNPYFNKMWSEVRLRKISLDQCG